MLVGGLSKRFASGSDEGGLGGGGGGGGEGGGGSGRCGG